MPWAIDLTLGFTLLLTALAAVVVRMAKHAPILIESKWGPLGVYLHTIEKQPFPGTWMFYRSARVDHLLAIRRANSGGERVAHALSDSAGAQ